jgi:hypothetical protein
MERPRHERFDGEMHRTFGSASRKPVREVCLRSPRITEVGMCVGRPSHQR